MDYAELRKAMVAKQLVERGIKDIKVLKAFSKIERHKFIPQELRPGAYADHPILIGLGQTISQPYIVALMTELLSLSGEEKILEIGTGSGYQTVILAELAKEVCTIERLDDLAKNAAGLFLELGIKNIKTRIADGTLGWPEEAPFDRIIITAATPRLPLPLSNQLKEGGKIVLPLGEERMGQVLTIGEKKADKIDFQPVCGCVFVPLIGKYGCKCQDN